MTVTQINAGSLHNVVRMSVVLWWMCPNEYYSNAEIVDFIKEQVKCEVTPRSLHLNASGIQATHPLVQQAVALGIHTYGSKTMSDQVHMPFPTIKMGPVILEDRHRR